jgi:uncharacterized CHY-type Zn-finger protein
MNKDINPKKYTFKRVDWQFDRLLICPNCFETLCRDDIEHFTKCPYCDYRFEFDCQIEDFILKPVVDRWIAFQRVPYENSAQIVL